MDFSKMSDEELEELAGGKPARPDYSSMSDEELERLANPPSKLESAARGAIQGASLGFADEISGGLESLFSDKTYEQARNESRANFERARKENPASYTSGEVGGGLATAFVPGLNIAKGASVGKSLLQAGGLGLATGAGYSDANDVGGLAEDSFKGAVVGGILGGTAHAASPLLQKGVESASRGAGKLADRFAARALGAERGTIKSLGADKVMAAGRQALDEGVLSPLANTDDLIARNEAVKSKGGQMMGQAYEAIDDAGASTFNPLDVAVQVEGELAPKFRTAINKGETTQLDNTLESITSRVGIDGFKDGMSNIPLKEAQALKEEIGAVAYPRGKRPIDPSPKQQMALDAYDIINRSIDDAVERGSAAIEGAGLADVLKRGKNIYGLGKTSEKLLDNKFAREQGNNFFGLTDTITGAGALGYGGTTGDWETAGGLMLGKKMLGKFGAQNAALGLDKVSKTLMKSPQMADLYAKNPNVFNVLARKMEDQIGHGRAAEVESKPFNQNALIERTQGSPYAKILQDAAKRGPQAFGAAHFVLQNKDPKYRQLTTGQQDDKE